MIPEPIEASVYRKLHATRDSHIEDLRRARAYQAQVAEPEVSGWVVIYILVGYVLGAATIVAFWLDK